MRTVLARRQGAAGLERLETRAAAALLARRGMARPVDGAAYGVILNTHAERAAMVAALSQPPYGAPPKAPVLFMKPVNTFADPGAAVSTPSGARDIEVRGDLALVIDADACRLTLDNALAHVGGFTLAIDLSLPQADYYRPAIRERCRDGFLPLGPWVTPRPDAPDPDALEIEVRVDGRVRARYGTADLVRPVARLLVDVTEFMTLRAGDILLVGAAPAPVLANPGANITIEARGLGALSCRLVAEDFL